jgi:hypothetical protein
VETYIINGDADRQSAAAWAHLEAVMIAQEPQYEAAAAAAGPPAPVAVAADGEHVDEFEVQVKRRRSAIAAGGDGPRQTTQEEIKAYRSIKVPEGMTCLQWWQHNHTMFPRIARLARMYLAVCASSAPSERVFSQLNLVVQRRTARLGGQRAARRVFTRHNLPLIFTPPNV